MEFQCKFSRNSKNIVRQAERADFSKLMICQIFSTDVKKTLGVQNYTLQLYNFETIQKKLVQI
jgi:hypothetical protein